MIKEILVLPRVDFLNKCEGSFGPLFYFDNMSVFQKLKFLQFLNCRHAIYHYSFLVVVQTTQKGLKGSFQSANSASASDAAIGSSLSMVIFLGGLSIRNSWSRWANSCSTHFTDSSRTTLAAICGFEHTVNTLVDKYLRTAKLLSYF